jgi:hypothetical protein
VRFSVNFLSLTLWPLLDDDVARSLRFANARAMCPPAARCCRAALSADSMSTGLTGSPNSVLGVTFGLGELRGTSFTLATGMTLAFPCCRPAWFGVPESSLRAVTVVAASVTEATAVIEATVADAAREEVVR